jgi:hypothetical protein
MAKGKGRNKKAKVKSFTAKLNNQFFKKYQVDRKSYEN